MSKSKILRKFRICLLFGLFAGLAQPVWAQPGDSGDFRERGWGRERRSFGRDSDSRGGFDPERREEMRLRFQQMRESGEGGFGYRPDGDNDSPDFDSGRWEGRGGFGRGDWGDRESRGGFGRGDWDRGAGPERSAELTRTTKIAPKERITVDLPSEFLDADLDRDGQIGLYEWRQWKRGGLDEFLAYDANRDGFLTPYELIRGPLVPISSGSRSEGQVAGASPSSSATASSSSSTPSSSSSGDSTASSTSSSVSPQTNRAKSIFRLLDKNRDGNISPSEWAASNNVRKQFEDANIALDQPMAQDDFVSHFVRINSSGN